MILSINRTAAVSGSGFTVKGARVELLIKVRTKCRVISVQYRGLNR